MVAAQIDRKNSVAWRLKVEKLAEALGLVLTDGFLRILLLEVRELLVIGGWRAGKTTILAALLFIWIFFRHVLPGKPGLFWLVGSQYDQTDAEYDSIVTWGQRLGIILKFGAAQEGSNEIVFRGGSKLITKSGAHPDKLGSVAPDIIGMCEAAQCSEEIMIMMRGRALEKDAPIIGAGTLEDDKGRPVHAWFQEAALAWLDGALCADAEEHDCAKEHYSVSWPTWANAFLFPEGENDPRIVRMRLLFKDKPFYWLRKFAGVPTGVQFPMYEDAISLRPKLLVPMPAGSAVAPMLRAAGGIDYGGVGIEASTNVEEQHLTTLCVGQMIADPRDLDPKFVGPKGIIWVRETRWHDHNPGDTSRLDNARKEMSLRWRCFTWNLDPNEKYMARSYKGEATSYSTSARMARVGLVKSRMALDKVFIDALGPGNVRLYDQLERVRRRKTSTGELIYDRHDDDGVAAFEDMIEAFDGKNIASLPKAATRTYPAQRRKEFARRG